jgi:hypothetical protein
VGDGEDRIIFSGVIDPKGHVQPDRVNETRGRLAKWKGRKVTVIVSRYVRPKTNPQLATYFGPILDAYCDYHGYTKDEMDQELRMAYLAPQLRVSKLTGEEVSFYPRIRDLNVEQMSEYLDRVIREGHLMGLVFAIDPQ